jgi:hypothetical protein
LKFDGMYLAIHPTGATFCGIAAKLVAPAAVASGMSQFLKFDVTPGGMEKPLPHFRGVTFRELIPKLLLIFLIVSGPGAGKKPLVMAAPARTDIPSLTASAATTSRSAVSSRLPYDLLGSWLGELVNSACSLIIFRR